MITFTKITAKHRTTRLNENLGRVLAFIAGFINAGGFFIVQQYTSHMTGILSISADELALGNYATSLLMLGFIGCFVFGASATTLIVVNTRKKHLHSQYALPLFLEALLIVFIIFLHKVMMDEMLAISITIALLCFIMGLQNALITKVSTAIIRTTHVTGMTTDLGIEIGRILSSHRKKDSGENLNNAWLHLSLICIFFVGGIIGALIVSHIGTIGLLPTSLLLVLISFPPLLKDVRFAQKLKNRIKKYS